MKNWGIPDNLNAQVEKNFSIATDNLFSYISKFKTVNTNHLHVGIAAALIGKTVNLYRGSYHKISGVYDFSIVNKFKTQHISYRILNFIKKICFRIFCCSYEVNIITSRWMCSTHDHSTSS